MINNIMSPVIEQQLLKPVISGGFISPAIPDQRITADGEPRITAEADDRIIATP